MKKLMILIIGVCMMSNVLALGISPAKIETEFELNKEQEFTVNVINNEAKTIDVAMYAQGELGEYVKFKPSKIKMEPSDYSKPVQFSLKLPKEIETPGVNEILVTAKEIVPNKEDQPIVIGSSVSVISVLKVNVPYQGKYATANIYVSEAEPGSEATIAIEVKNLGKEKITRAKATVNIINPEGESAATLNTDEKSIEPGTKRELITKWTPTEAGTYKAVSLINYDEKQTTATKEFQVGNFFLRLLSVTVKNFKLGGIAKFDILTQNIGNEMIMQAFSKIMLDKNNQKIMDAESNRVDMNKGETRVMNIYWDTEGVAKGIYYGIVRLVYLDKSSEKKIKMTINENEIETEILPTGFAIAPEEETKQGVKNKSIIFVMILFLIIFLLFIFFLIKRRKKDDKTEDQTKKQDKNTTKPKKTAKKRQTETSKAVNNPEQTEESQKNL